MSDRSAIEELASGRRTVGVAPPPKPAAVPEAAAAPGEPAVEVIDLAVIEADQNQLEASPPTSKPRQRSAPSRRNQRR